MHRWRLHALWNINSTKDIEKYGHIDQIIDHFVALFAHEGVELPPFPFDPMKNHIKLDQIDNLYRQDSPEFSDEVSANKF